MKAFEVWQRLWEKAAIRCDRAYVDFEYACHDNWPTSELLKVWNNYDRWAKVREYIAQRHRDCVIN